MSQIKKIIILGHSGFIGRNLERYFQEKYSHIQVVGKSLPILDLTSYDQTLQLKGFFDKHSAVIICAAVKKQLGDSLHAFMENMKIITNISTLMREKNVGRVIFFSSAAVYGEDIDDTSISEETSVRPRSYYGIAKYASEIVLEKTIKDTEKCSLAIVRPPQVYGPGDQSFYGPSGFANSLVKKKQIVLWGDGLEKREFLFIDDLLEIISELTFSDFEGILNLASGISRTYIDSINAITPLTEDQPNIIYRERTKKKVNHKFLSNKIKSVVPSIKFTSLEEGMKKTYEYFKSRGEN